jgi:hypothetical protein
MKGGKLTIIKRYYFDMDGKKIMDHYSTYHGSQAFVTANSLDDLSKKVIKYGGSICYKVPKTIIRSELIRERGTNNKNKKRHRFLGQVEYFHEPLSNKEREYINTKTNQKSINRESRINNSLEDKLTEPAYN